MTAISQRDQTGFIRQAVLYVGVFAGSTAVVGLPGQKRRVVHSYVRGKIFFRGCCYFFSVSPLLAFKRSSRCSISIL
jgi:hypothetical protein